LKLVARELVEYNFDQFDQFHIYCIRILLLDFNAEIKEEDVSKPVTGNERCIKVQLGPYVK
jgi:hypothetical protein